MTRYTITIPAAPPSFNVYNGWPPYKQRAEKRAWQSMVMALLNEKGNRAPRGLERVRLRSVISFATKRGRDGDNYIVPFYKWTQDQLVRSGVLVDDTADRCEAIRPVFVDGKTEQTFLVIEEG